MDNNSYEHDVALRESSRIQSNDEYFKARPHIVASFESLNIFDAGYDRGWQAAQQQSSETNASLVRMNLSLAKENGALKADNERLREALEIAKISSCSCLTKTHEHEYHDKNCRYRIYCEALSATTSQSLQAHDERNP
jgi:hypothetical protein